MKQLLFFLIPWLVHALSSASGHLRHHDEMLQLDLRELADDASHATQLASLSSSFSAHLASVTLSAASALAEMQSRVQAAERAVATLERRAVGGENVGTVNNTAISAAGVGRNASSSVLVAVTAQRTAAAAAAATAQVVAAGSSVSAARVLPTAGTAQAAGQLQPLQPQPQQKSIASDNLLGACSTPEVILAFSGIGLGAVGLISLIVTALVLCCRRRAKKAGNAFQGNSIDDFPPISQSTSSSLESKDMSSSSSKQRGGRLQWRQRAPVPAVTLSVQATPIPAAASRKEGSVMSSDKVGEVLYTLPEYERIFPDKSFDVSRQSQFASFRTDPEDKSRDEDTENGTASSPRIQSEADEREADSSKDRNNRDNKSDKETRVDNDNDSTADTVPPLASESGHKTFSRSFSRLTGRSFLATMQPPLPATTATIQPRPTSSVYEPFDRDTQSFLKRADTAPAGGVPRLSRQSLWGGSRRRTEYDIESIFSDYYDGDGDGDRISRIEDDWRLWVESRKSVATETTDKTDKTDRTDEAEQADKQEMTSKEAYRFVSKSTEEMPEKAGARGMAAAATFTNTESTGAAAASTGPLGAATMSSAAVPASRIQKAPAKPPPTVPLPRLPVSAARDKPQDGGRRGRTPPWW